MELDELREISKILTPELLKFLELTQGVEGAVMPVKADKLVRMGEAAKVLDTNTTMISRYVREGLLKPVYTPYSRQRKFWLSEVKGLARRCDA